MASFQFFGIVLLFLVARCSSENPAPAGVADAMMRAGQAAFGNAYPTMIGTYHAGQFQPNPGAWDQLSMEMFASLLKELGMYAGHYKLLGNQDPMQDSFEYHGRTRVTGLDLVLRTQIPLVNSLEMSKKVPCTFCKYDPRKVPENPVLGAVQDFLNTTAGVTAPTVKDLIGVDVPSKSALTKGAHKHVQHSATALAGAGVVVKRTDDEAVTNSSSQNSTSMDDNNTSVIEELTTVELTTEAVEEELINVSHLAGAIKPTNAEQPKMAAAEEQATSAPVEQPKPVIEEPQLDIIQPASVVPNLEKKAVEVDATLDSSSTTTTAPPTTTQPEVSPEATMPPPAMGFGISKQQWFKPQQFGGYRGYPQMFPQMPFY